MKRKLIMTLSTAFIVSSLNIANVSADELNASEPMVTTTSNSVQVPYANGYIPIRDTFEGLGYTVLWSDDDNGKVNTIVDDPTSTTPLMTINFTTNEVSTDDFSTNALDIMLSANTAYISTDSLAKIFDATITVADNTATVMLNDDTPFEIDNESTNSVDPYYVFDNNKPSNLGDLPQNFIDYLNGDEFDVDYFTSDFAAINGNGLYLVGTDFYAINNGDSYSVIGFIANTNDTPTEPTTIYMHEFDMYNEYLDTAEIEIPAIDANSGYAFNKEIPYEVYNYIIDSNPEYTSNYNTNSSNNLPDEIYTKINGLLDNPTYANEAPQYVKDYLTNKDYLDIFTTANDYIDYLNIDTEDFDYVSVLGSDFIADDDNNGYFVVMLENNSDTAVTDLPITISMNTYSDIADTNNTVTISVDSIEPANPTFVIFPISDYANTDYPRVITIGYATSAYTDVIADDYTDYYENNPLTDLLDNPVYTDATPESVREYFDEQSYLDTFDTEEQYLDYLSFDEDDYGDFTILGSDFIDGYFVAAIQNNGDDATDIPVTIASDESDASYNIYKTDTTTGNIDSLNAGDVILFSIELVDNDLRNNSYPYIISIDGVESTTSLDEINFGFEDDYGSITPDEDYYNSPS